VRHALLLALLAALVIAAPATALPSEYILPGEDVFPEGVTVRPGTDQFFVTSTSSGTVFRGTFGKSRTKVFLPGGEDRPLANGITATRDHLIVAGSLSNRVYIYDIDTRRLIRRYSTGEGGLINDVTVAPNGDAYATDSSRGLLFRLPASSFERRRPGTKALLPFVRFETTPLELYSNGLVPAGRRYMLVVSTSTGALVRVDLKTRQIRAVQVTGGELPVGDGMARDGRTLYVVNSISRVSQLKLSANWLKARVVRQITSPRFRFPTTVAIAGGRLLVVNSQFSQRGRSPVLPFTVSAVRRP